MTDTPVLIGLYANVILLIIGAYYAYKYMPIKWLKVTLMVSLLSGAGFIIYGINISHDDVAIFHRK